jgi:hypothetical protein
MEVSSTSFASLYTGSAKTERTKIRGAVSKPEHTFPCYRIRPPEIDVWTPLYRVIGRDRRPSARICCCSAHIAIATFSRSPRRIFNSRDTTTYSWSTVFKFVQRVEIRNPHTNQTTEDIPDNFSPE